MILSGSPGAEMYTDLAEEVFHLPRGKLQHEGAIGSNRFELISIGFKCFICKETSFSVLGRDLQ